MKLAAFERRWAEGILAAIFPGSAEDGLAGIGSMDVAAYLNDVMCSLPLRAALGMRIAVWIVALSPLFVLGRFALFAALGSAERERVLERLVTSRRYGVRSLVLFLKTMGALLYAGDDRVRARMRLASPLRSIAGLRGLRAGRAHGA